MDPVTRKVILVMLWFGALVVVADVWSFRRFGAAGTISGAMSAASDAFPLLIVICGGLSAHFFCYETSSWNGWWPESRPVLLFLGGMIIYRALIAVAWRMLG